jgi:cohesin loading factor subunit SCC2
MLARASLSQTQEQTIIHLYHEQDQQQQNKTSHQNTKRIHRFYNRIREILNLFGELIKMSDLTDTIVITVSTVCIQCFFIDNINDLQLESMRLLTNVFTKYDIHRHLIIDDILSSIAKLQTTKRNLRTYKCLNGDSIQMLSALSMQLIQSEVSSVDDDDHNNNNNNNADNNVYDEHETIFLNTYENASQTGRKFLSVFFHKCKNKQFDFDFRLIFENFVQDLLVTANKPEWPVAEFIINMLGIILVNQINNERNDVATRVNSLDYLGQIVAQLRKDSVDLKKQTSQQPDKLNALLDRVNANIEWLSDTMSTTTTTADVDQELVILKIQKALIFYMESLEANDACLVHAKRFFIAQCLKELNAKAAATTTTDNAANDNNLKIERYTRLEKQRKELYSLLKHDKNATKQEGKQNILDYTEAVLLGQYLTSLKKSLDKNFDYYLVNILNLLGSATEHIPTQVRSKALKCLSLIIEADTQVLLKHKVFQCVQANFLHQTISVREAAVDLIGRFICLKPELTTHYYQLLSDRILDVGVSVRKRVIKIFRDICMSQVKFDFMCEICVKMLRRVNDEDGIRKLVIDTFYNLWFTPLGNNHAQHVLLDRVLNIVDVISEFNTNSNNGAASANCAQTSEFFEQLFNSLIVHSPHNQTTDVLDHHQPQQQQQVTMSTTTTTSSAEQQQQQQKSKDVLRSCKQIVDCLVDNVLNIEAKANTANGYKRLVACFSTLYLFSKIIPENFVHHAETILPYLNIKSSVCAI